MLFYLSGSIEYAPDGGRAWRAELAPMLHACGHEVYDPALDTRKDLEPGVAAEFRAWKTTDLSRFRHTVRRIIAYDLDRVSKSDALIVYWDEHAARGAGTQGEVTFAHRSGIPVYLVLGMPLERASGWMLGCATEVFAGFEELHAFLAAAPGPLAATHKEFA